MNEILLGPTCNAEASEGFGEYAATFVEENKPQYYSPRLMLLKLKALMPNNFYKRKFCFVHRHNNSCYAPISDEANFLATVELR
jgi:hypothetical protein